MRLQGEKLVSDSFDFKSGDDIEQLNTMGGSTIKNTLSPASVRADEGV